jgi:excisionase family DNA binding protein
MSNAYDSPPDGMTLAVLRTLERLEDRLSAVEALLGRLAEERKSDWPATGGVMTAAQVAEALGCSLQFVYDRFRSGELPGYPLGSDKRFYRDGVAAWLRANGNQPRRSAAAPDEGAVASGEDKEAAAAGPGGAPAPRPASARRRGRRPAWDRHTGVTKRAA